MSQLCTLKAAFKQEALTAAKLETQLKSICSDLSPCKCAYEKYNTQLNNFFKESEHHEIFEPAVHLEINMMNIKNVRMYKKKSKYSQYI